MRALRLFVTGVSAAFAVVCSAALAPAPLVPAPLVPAALGLEPGVHVDPGSPAATEYALPLNQARQTGQRAATNEASSASAPFGAGIRPPGSGGSSPPGLRANGGRPGARHALSGVPRAGARGTRVTVPAAVLRASSSRASSGGDGSLPALLGGGFATLILGGFGGMLMRRSRRRPLGVKTR